MRKEEFKTKNLKLASFLYASGLELTSTDKVNSEVIFEFYPKKKAEDLIADYFSGRANVNPRELFARLDDLRDLIFSEGKYG